MFMTVYITPFPPNKLHDMYIKCCVFYSTVKMRVFFYTIDVLLIKYVCGQG